jgi:uncharacterized membrane protein YccC
MQRLITEDSPNPRRVEAAMTVATYGRRMASTLSALAEARARDGSVVAPSESSALTAQLDSAIESLDGSSSRAPANESPRAEALRERSGSASSLQAAQIERLHAQLAVLSRAVVRYDEG